MQTQQPLATASAKALQYTGTVQCIRSIVARDSVAGLYRGLSSPLAGVALINAIVFGVYGNVQRRAAEPDALRTQMFAGMAAGLVQSVITSPMELTKTRMQMQCATGASHVTKATTAPHHQYRGAVDCARHIQRTEGLRGLYRGLSITVARDVPGFASYFVLYELLVRAGSSQSGSSDARPGALHTLLAGGAAGVGSWILTMPIDVVKTRLQVDGTAARYTGIADCVRQSWRTEGWRFLTRGMSSTLLRAFLMNSVCFYVVAFVMHSCDSDSSSSSGGEAAVAVLVDTAEPLLMAAAGSAHGLLAERSMPDQKQMRTIELTEQEDSRCAESSWAIPLSKRVMYLSALSDAVCKEDILEYETDCRREEAPKNVPNYYDATHVLLNLDTKGFLDDQLRLESKCK